MEFLGNYDLPLNNEESKKTIPIYDDYGHHPTEVKATLQAFRQKFPNKRILVVFQPHLYSRTKLLMEDFAQSFTEADQIIITHIYFAREKQEDFGITGQDLVDKINENHEKGAIATFQDSFEKTSNYLSSQMQENDVILTLGAGNAWQVGKTLLSQE